MGLGFVYNGDPDDEGGSGYGLNPPSVGIDFFQGPLADPNDGIDNNKDDIEHAAEGIRCIKYIMVMKFFSRR